MSRTWLSRTWLLRGGAAAVFGVLASSWALGAAGIGGPAPVKPEQAPATPEELVDLGPGRPVVLDRGKPRRTPKPKPSEATTEPSAENGGATGTEATRPPEPASKSPRSEPSPSPKPRSPKSRTPSPSNSPSGTPSEPPSPRCTDLPSAIDCMFAPMTRQPSAG